ncbi:actinorhodin polyketide beta-ketoacyl synthase [Microtetraspora sp. NBRC 13810]|uniref:ketosynthase chain-length factor n=1 Tax=Microtetraspora sp. NBRC 13810 TaxID=3030990 RepID=UPI0024A59E16|nr:ketosynthase chain-length factor [Microtetraspora sp. NBRC 13810]GLW06770.1 actinorhodin polyketide beta-ketoacyl synthase [Microtetraspora sp. NBRC 13810]
MTRRAVVTGIGVTAPNGLGAEAYWAATLEGRNGIGPISRFDPSGYPVRVAGEVADFAAAEHVPSRLIPQTDNWTHLGLAAAAWALEDAGVEPSAFPEYEMAVMTASSSGGTEFGQREIERLWSKGPSWVGAYQSIAWFYAATTGQISIRHGMRGPCGVVCAEQAGALNAAGQARHLIETGTRLVVTGGTDAALCPYGLTAQYSNGRMSEAGDPDRAYLPFGVDAAGYVPGEGGAMLIVEDEADARARSAPVVYGTIAGHASTFDPRPGSGREPGLRRAMELALADAGLTAGDVDVVFADAAGVPELDLQEAAAIGAVFGPRGVPVTAPKTMTGRLYAGGAALDLAAALLSVRDDVIPPTTGVTELAPGCDLDLVRGAARETRVGAALVVARGYGGFNAAVIVTKADQRSTR